jgi:hypothetical protein
MEYFNREGKIPVHKDWLQIYVKGEMMNCAEVFRILVEISSHPCELEGFRDEITFLISLVDVCLDLILAKGLLKV